ncbi:MAG: UbiA family prenyltransferase [Ketobacteraceae bacterium]|nr:UbiA family prenyltransferase [Ketobacteraceae bacterium]
MSAHGLTLSSPLHKRFFAWMDERFPAANSIVVIVLYLVCSAVARYSATGGEYTLYVTDLIGAFVTWSMFLLLRVFDEHKDYELDVKNYPERVLQSGLITLKHLKVVGALAVLCQIAWSFILGGGIAGPLVAWLIMIIWAGLMTAEFFCGEWLEKRLTLYALSHMAIMPLIIWWVVNLAVPGLAFDHMIGALMTLAFVSGFCFEITRKTRGPEEERDTVDSYTKIYGVKGCSMIILALLTAMAAIQFYMISHIVESHFITGYVLVLVFIGMAALSVLKFMKSPSLPGREKNEKMIGLSMIGGYSVVVSAVIVERGFAVAIY